MDDYNYTDTREFEAGEHVYCLECDTPVNVNEVEEDWPICAECEAAGA